ncbi:hypothetical protein OG21DRAFT_1430442 [Imleria badia]|nr:hypothetical protein OG21DRAFT_1430442 [Imleria badia]
MHPFYANVPPPTAPHMHDLAAPPNQSSLTFDEMIKQRYTDSDNKVRNAISRTRFPDPEAKQECLHFVSILRIHKVRILNILDVHNYRPTPTKHLFMHTYVHLVSCCNGRCVLFPFHPKQAHYPANTDICICWWKLPTFGRDGVVCSNSLTIP